jgi:hypothetical protein
MYEHRDDIQPEAPSAETDRVQRWLMGGLAAAVAVTVLAAIPGILLDRGGKTDEVRTAAPSATTTTAAAPAVLPGETTPLVPAPSTTVKKGVVTPVLGARPAATTTTPITSANPVCRNSYDPKCGPFRWDPDPGPNQPLKVTVTPEQQQVSATQPVNFHVVAEDPDAKIDDCVFIDWGDGQTTPPCPPSPACPAPYGPWSPPTKMPDSDVRDVSHTYQTARPEPYIASFRFQSRSFCSPDPYGGTTTGNSRVTVSA